MWLEIRPILDAFPNKLYTQISHNWQDNSFRQLVDKTLFTHICTTVRQPLSLRNRLDNWSPNSKNIFQTFDQKNFERLFGVTIRELAFNRS